MLHKISIHLCKEPHYTSENSYCFREGPFEFIISNRIGMKFPLTKSQFLNLLAIELLDKLGNNHPSQSEIDYIESVLIKNKGFLYAYKTIYAKKIK